MNMAGFPAFIPLHPKLVSPFFAKINTSKYVESVENNKERNASSVEEELKKETLCPFGYPSFFAHEDGIGSSMDAAKSALYETSARILLLSIRWARNLPSYSSLGLQDQNVRNTQIPIGYTPKFQIPYKFQNPYSSVAFLSKYLHSNMLKTTEKNWTRFEGRS
ncbi:photoreceptor-specific nuclear receptor [Trichonephila inaurata madagascariensis]|uniref:Photoreceptor-specific nuclear receptor n=1 Tax=Trichonephila inaurata madagascariensis TaxID=2747483 RepID=A0A8X7CGN7_9ARAC|nr:photoreceptor-specific nuclear receptor [Trichonephila inaurata madagascariensis]